MNTEPGKAYCMQAKHQTTFLNKIQLLYLKDSLLSDVNQYLSASIKLWKNKTVCLRKKCSVPH